ncbi:VOC family protein [Lysinibacillus capsici]|uniref:VOC family protein n=1 Tax=Lysinibacillus capsici TaxID=2115968 RepID=UPI003679B6D8
MFLVEYVEYLEFKTPKLKEMTDYYEKELGMTRINGSTSERVLLGFGNKFPSLILQQSETFSLGEIGFKVHGKNEWEQIINRLKDQNIPYDILDSEFYGPVLSFEDVDRHPLKLHYAQTYTAQSGNQTSRFGPILSRLHHVTYASPQPMEVAKFYEEVLNFKISDMVEGGNFVWLRTNPEHHTIAAAAHTSVGLDHFCFELPNWESFKEWCDYLGDQDVEIIWGPGRHGPGNNLFFFTLDPDGNRIEYTCEVEQFRDNHMEYTNRVWKNSPKTVNLWGPGAPWARELPPS